MSEIRVLLGIAVAASSGLPGLFARRGSIGGPRATTRLAVIGALPGLAGIARSWATGASRRPGLQDRGVALLALPRVPAGELPDGRALHLLRRDRPAALAPGGTS